MKAIWRVYGTTVLAAITTFAVSAEGQLASTQKVTMPSQVSYGLEKWRHGHMISVETGQPESGTFTVSDTEGTDHTVFSFSIPDATRTWISDFDLDAGGGVIFCGQSYSADGRLAPFIAVKESGAVEVKVVRTYPYRPWAISVAPDGTIWTSGFESAQERESIVVNQNGDVIRHFDRAGKLIASTLPYGELINQPSRAVSGMLVATSDRVGWYSPSSGKGGKYMEISSDLKSHIVYPGVPDPQGYGQVLGFALSESGDAYLTWDTKASRTTYKLDRSLKRWVEISVPQDQKDIIPVLKGEEKGELVFRNGTTLDFLSPAIH